ncbi:MAG: multicopper oxidase domain-containing protein, partial [Bacteroidetes bacterium]|nr:multicopper oxidase domain-containing protein [Bacteroidota bacterium]
MPIPPLMTGTVQDGVVTYDLNMQQGMMEFLPGLQTATWGYNGEYLGPTLMLRKGDQVMLRVTNDIGVTTTTHWHGMHVPAVMDGGPHQRIEPGETWIASFEVLNRAATYWYHPHPHAMLSQGVIFDPESTGYQVYQGLAGMLIIEDDTSDTLALPRSYGQDDIPLILQDRRFNDDG